MNKVGNALLAFVLMCLSLILSSCSDNGNVTNRQEIFVSIPPVAFIVKAIAGDKVKVCTMIPEGKSPHDYSPFPRQVALLQNCKAYFTIGMPFEKQVIESLFKDHRDRLVDISKGIKRREIDQEHTHSHHVHTESCQHEDEDGDKDHLDPHIWLSPANDIILTRNATAELCRLFPEHAAVFKANGQALEKRFTVLQKGLEKLLAQRKGEVFYVYHPAFGYFADAFGLKEEAVETGGKSPSPKHLNEMIAAARKDKVKIIFVQPQFNQRCADVIARALDANVMPLDPLSDDLFDFYHKITAALVEGTSGKKTDE